MTDEAPRHPSQREDLEHWIADFGATWKFDPDVDPKKIDYERSLQNQARINYPLNDTTVDIYTEAMERGDIFPAPILYWNGNKLLAVDGNHRLKAKFNTGKQIEAYILDKNTKPQTTMLMTFEANAKHGLPNSVEERIEHAMTLLAAGAKKEDAAIRLNLTKSQVTRRWDNLRATQMAEQANITKADWAKISGSGQNRLAAIREVDVFAKAASLAIRARLSTTEVNAMVVELNKLRSMKEQLAYIEQLEPIYADRIQESGGGALGNHRTNWTSPRARISMTISHARRLFESYGTEDDVEALLRNIHQSEVPDFVENLRREALDLEELARLMEEKSKQVAEVQGA